MTDQTYKILVVDDEEDVQPLFLQRMRRDIRAGRYELVFAGTGVEALQRLNEDRDIDMVVTDINMPEMDGLTLLEQIPSVDPNIKSVNHYLGLRRYEEHTDGDESGCVRLSLRSRWILMICGLP